MNQTTNHNLKSPAKVLDDLREQGYTTDFRYANNRLIPFNNSAKSYGPNSFKVVEIYRFEGNTDPADDSILYVIHGEDGTRGTISNGYREYANSELDEFINSSEKLKS